MLWYNIVVYCWEMSSKFDEFGESRSRYCDMVSEPQRILPPIQGFQDEPLVSLEEAVKPLASIVQDINQMIHTVKDHCHQPEDGLSKDESASIMLYTLEWGPPQRPFYSILNEKLRAKKRAELTPWSLYLRLFIHALSKLPSSEQRVIYRGVKKDLASEYLEGTERVWWAFSSCSLSIGVLESIIGRTGKRTIFNITCNSAKDISRHSFYPEEREVLLYPARQFKVRSSLNAGNELYIIDLEENEPLFPFLKIPSTNEQCINILLIGEKGVGKSTFINAFVNYLRFNTVNQARSNQPLVLKPLSFVMLTENTFEQQIIEYGDLDLRNDSVRRRCHTYTFKLDQNGGRKLCLIDTPSLKDSQDPDLNNSNNIKHILDHVNSLTHLNAVCFLLQPDASRLMNSFQLCFGELMNRFGSRIRENIVFCFTNAYSTFSMPGNTVVLLRRMFNSLSMNDTPFSRTNTFIFDNESFRYLMAVKNGIKFNGEDTREYEMTWSESVNESRRLLDYILTNLNPCYIAKKE